MYCVHYYICLFFVNWFEAFIFIKKKHKNTDVFDINHSSKKKLWLWVKTDIGHIAKTLYSQSCKRSFDEE